MQELQRVLVSSSSVGNPETLCRHTIYNCSGRFDTFSSESVKVRKEELVKQIDRRGRCKVAPLQADAATHHCAFVTTINTLIRADTFSHLSQFGMVKI